MQDAADTIRELVHRWTAPAMDPGPLRAALLAVWSTRPEEQLYLKRRIARKLLLDLLADRREAYQACKDFIADHPQSRYVPNVLFVQARALDTRLDERKLIGDAAQRELYTDFPHMASEPVWTNLVTQYPDSPLAVAARLRLAQLHLRQGDIDTALASLTPTVATPYEPADRASEPTMDSLLRTAPPEASLDFEPGALTVFEARASARADPGQSRRSATYGVEPRSRPWPHARPAPRANTWTQLQSPGGRSIPTACSTTISSCAGHWHTPIGANAPANWKSAWPPTPPATHPPRPCSNLPSSRSTPSAAKMKNHAAAAWPGSPSWYKRTRTVAGPAAPEIGST